jgi:hypothetical protein
MMAIIQPTMEHVQARNPVSSLDPPPPLPPEPSMDDQRALQIQLRTHGSKEIGDAFQDWSRKVQSFLLLATTYEMMREHGQELGDSRALMDGARERAQEAADKLARLVSDELASF